MDYSTLRLESDHEDICDEMERELEEKRLARKRWLTLLAISSLFIISATILTISVVHDMKARAKDPEWEEFSCKQNDPDCIHSLCPEGMVWDMVEDKCREMPGINDIIIIIIIFIIFVQVILAALLVPMSTSVSMLVWLR